MQVVVAEGAPDFGGHKLARALAEAGIESTAIADSAIFAMMARVNKVCPLDTSMLSNPQMKTGSSNEVQVLSTSLVLSKLRSTLEFLIFWILKTGILLQKWVDNRQCKSLNSTYYPILDNTTGVCPASFGP